MTLHVVTLFGLAMTPISFIEPPLEAVSIAHIFFCDYCNGGLSRKAKYVFLRLKEPRQDNVDWRLKRTVEPEF